MSIKIASVLQWIRSNLITVIMALVLLAGVFVIPMISGYVNASVQKTLQKRATQFRSMDTLQKTNVLVSSGEGGVSPVQEPVLINRRLLDAYSSLREARRGDAEDVLQLASSFNQGQHVILNRDLFPDPPEARMQVLPKIFVQQLQDLYTNRLLAARCGTPQPTEMHVQSLERLKAQFLTQFTGGDEEDLSETELERLRDYLSKARVSLYAEDASRVNFYVDIDGVGRPYWDDRMVPSLHALFSQQWDYWIFCDVFDALLASNGIDGVVKRSPLKRFMSLAITPLAAGDGSASGGSQGAAGAMGMGRSDGGRGSGDPAVPAGIPAAMGSGTADYATSFTGRTSNSLYDVRGVYLVVHVETERIPVLLDSFARQNLMTILSLEITPVDRFELIREGFVYGARPVSEVTIYLETLWLRSWTTTSMPRVVKDAMGIPSLPLAGDSAASEG